MLFAEEIAELRSVVDEAIRGLPTIRREINPLRAKGPNPIKDIVRTTRKARRTRASQDITSARLAHHIGKMYATHHGLDRLAAQIPRHMRTLPKPRPAKLKRKPLPRRKVQN